MSLLKYNEDFTEMKLICFKKRIIICRLIDYIICFIDVLALIDENKELLTKLTKLDIHF